MSVETMSAAPVTKRLPPYRGRRGRGSCRAAGCRRIRDQFSAQEIVDERSQSTARAHRGQNSPDHRKTSKPSASRSRKRPRWSSSARSSRASCCVRAMPWPSATEPSPPQLPGALQFPLFSRRRSIDEGDAQRFTIFRHRSPGDIDSLLAQGLDDGIVGEDTLRLLLVNHLLDPIAYRFRRMRGLARCARNRRGERNISSRTRRDCCRSICSR